MGKCTSCIAILVVFIGCSFCIPPNLSSAAQASTSSLRFVHALWRHGDRSPAWGTFPGDPNQKWPEGWGELTKKGMREQYRLGQYLRQRYIDTGFLSCDYNSTEIYVRSTSYNRTITSALCNLAGMYPPVPGDSWMEGMAWQPIPVYSVPRMDDPVAWTDRPCPKANDIMVEVMNSSEIKKFERDNKEFFAFLRNMTGFPLKNPNDIKFVYDPLFCEEKNNKTWPSWVTKEIYDKVVSLYNYLTRFYVPDPRLQRLRGGLLIGEIASRFLSIAKNIDQPAALKYYAYSAHDTTVLVQLVVLGAFENILPPYASAILYELHEKQPGNFTVEIYYTKDQGQTPPTLINLQECGQPCHLDAFVAFAANRTPTDWYAECGLSSKEPKA